MFESKQIELKVTGMSCTHCEMRVKKALESVKGIQSAKADHKKGNVVIQADEGVNKEALVKAVNETGMYKAQA
ncbi:MAG: cation transporter [Candidatus Bathyarchaeota archaeon]